MYNSFFLLDFFGLRSLSVISVMFTLYYTVANQLIEVLVNEVIYVI